MLTIYPYIQTHIDDEIPHHTRQRFVFALLCPSRVVRSRIVHRLRVPSTRSIPTRYRYRYRYRRETSTFPPTRGCTLVRVLRRTTEIKNKRHARVARRDEEKRFAFYPSTERTDARVTHPPRPTQDCPGDAPRGGVGRSHVPCTPVYEPSSSSSSSSSSPSSSSVSEEE